MGLRQSDNRVSEFTKEPLTLPAPINSSNRLSSFVVGLIIFMLGYSIPNHYHLYIPKQLPLTGVDTNTPLIPWTVFIYITEYIYFFFVYFFLKEDERRNRLLWTLFTAEFICVLFFIFFPTTYPRTAHPIPPHTHWLASYTFYALRMIDDPSNSFPSLHVTACFIGAFIFYGESRIKFITFTLWAIVIAISTLTTKQHYIIDVIGGLFLAIISAYFFAKKVRYKDLDEQSEPKGIYSSDNQILPS